MSDLAARAMARAISIGIKDSHVTKTCLKFYNNLFQGAARLGILLGTLDLPWLRIRPYITMFSQELNGYQELSIDTEGTTLGLMTRGSGKDFAFRMTRYMETHGILETSLRRFLARARFFGYPTFFFKVEIGAEGPNEFSYYLRQRTSLDVAKAWLAELGVEVQGLALLEACAEVLEKRSVHFLAAAERPGAGNLQKVYFSQPTDGRAWERIHLAGRLCGLGASDWSALEAHRSALVHRPLFFSLAFSGASASPGAKVDLQGVGLEIVKDLMKRAGSSEEARQRTALLLELSEKKRSDYLGLYLRPGLPPRTKAYVYQGEGKHAANSPSLRG